MLTVSRATAQTTELGGMHEEQAAVHRKQSEELQIQTPLKLKEVRFKRVAVMWISLCISLY